MLAFNYLFIGFSELTRPGLKRWIAIPLALNTLLFTIVIWLLTTLVADWIAAAVATLSLEGTWFAFLDSILSVILWLIFGVSAALFLYYAFIRVAFILAGPFNSFLADRYEAQLTGQTLPDSSYGELWRSVWPMLKNELGKLTYELSRTAAIAVLCLLLSFFTPLSIFVPLIWFGFNAWIYGFLYLDYPMDNNNLKLQDELAILHSNKLLTLSFGSSIALVTMVPVLNFFVMPAAVLGATKLWQDKLKPDADIQNGSTQNTNTHNNTTVCYDVNK